VIPNIEAFSEFNNIDLKYELLTFSIDLRKLNDSMVALDRSYDELKKSYLSKVLTDKEYLFNLNNMIPDLNKLIKFLEDAQKKIIRIAALVRIFLRDKPFTVSILQRTKHFSKNIKKDLPNEILKLEKEIAAVVQQSEKEIKEILSK
jgi:hypothetical protein